MQNFGKIAFFLALATLVAGFQLFASPRAHAQSSYFTSRGCVSCHAAPVASTCAGCHQHSGTLTATKNKTTAYAPGETVAITLTASGARSGWIGVRLYDQNNAEIARSSGNQSGMGSAATYPAVLSAPAPAAAGNYTWRIAYFGNNNGTGTRDVHSEKSVNVAFTVAAPADTVAPTVSAFTLAPVAGTLAVPVSAFNASDNVAVSGYLITTSATKPLASAAGWSAVAPLSATAPAAGKVTFYAWARDAAGNVSAARSAVANVSLDPTADIINPTFLISSLGNGAITGNPVLNVSGRVMDDVALKFFAINGVRVSLNATGQFSTALPLIEGENLIKFVAVDAAGNRIAKARRVIGQALAPTLAITAPADNLATAQSLCTVSGTASANAVVTVTVNGKNPQLAALTGSTFSASVYLLPGYNTIAVEAVDVAGKVSNAKRTVLHNASKPTLAITAPAQDLVVNTPDLVLSGSVADVQGAVKVLVSVDGQTFRPAVSNGVFTQNLTLSAAQQYSVVVTVIDAAGAKVSTVRNVIYQP